MKKITMTFIVDDGVYSEVDNEILWGNYANAVEILSEDANSKQVFVEDYNDDDDTDNNSVGNEDAFVVELSDGTEVECREVWYCDNDLYDGSPCGSYIDVIDCENNRCIKTFRGTLPDEGDDIDAFIENVEKNLW